jgi:hypothetical protein
VRNAWWAVLLICIGLGFPNAASADQAEIGMIKTLKGTGSIIAQDHKTVAAVGALLHQNDTVETGDDSALGITFVDNTTMSLGPHTQITLTQYVFEPRENKFALVANLTKGSLEFISGLMSKLSPESVALHTPVGTLGVRGTRFLVDIGQ